MSRTPSKIHNINDSKKSLEAKLEKAKAENQEAGSKEVNAILEERGLAFAVMVQTGNVAQPLDKVLALPFQLIVISK